MPELYQENWTMQSMSTVSASFGFVQQFGHVNRQMWGIGLPAEF